MIEGILATAATALVVYSWRKLPTRLPTVAAITEGSPQATSTTNRIMGQVEALRRKNDQLKEKVREAESAEGAPGQRERVDTLKEMMLAQLSANVSLQKLVGARVLHDVMGKPITPEDGNALLGIIENLSCRTDTLLGPSATQEADKNDFLSETSRFVRESSGRIVGLQAAVDPTEHRCPVCLDTTRECEHGKGGHDDDCAVAPYQCRHALCHRCALRGAAEQSMLQCPMCRAEVVV